MKGIVLAGGSGSRLYPLTLVTSKQLLPVYDKPMIYYPLSVLMLAGIREILIISTPRDLEKFQDLLGNGQRFGIQLTYQAQPFPGGLAEAFILGERFIGADSCAMVLGDNIFYGAGLSDKLREAARRKVGATVFGYYVDDPGRFGVIEFDRDQRVVSIEEKPSAPKSNYAVTGLYFYDNTVCHRAHALRPSMRNELEITDLNRSYLEDGQLNVSLLGRGYAWLDAGTTDSLAQAGEFVRVVESRQGIKLAALEEIAYSAGWIGREELLHAAAQYRDTPYGAHLINVANKKYLYKRCGETVR